MHRRGKRRCWWSLAMAMALLSTHGVGCRSLQQVGKAEAAEGRRWKEERPRRIRDGTRRPRAFVCITGQLSRLDLDGKIDNLFRPLHETHDVDLAFVLSRGKASFVAKRNEQVFHEQVPPNFETFEDVQAKVSGKFGIVRVQEVEQPRLPLLNPGYVDLLDKNNINRTLKEERSRSHIRQWYAHQRCLDMMDRFEKAIKRRYNIVMRMREDLHIVRPADISHLLENVRRRILVVQRCDSWGGMNDKLVILDRSTAVRYFTTPLQQFYLHPREMLNTTGPLSVSNPETFLLKAYRRVGIQVVYVPAETLLGIPVRRTSTATTCFPLGLRSISCLRRQVEHGTMMHLQGRRCT